jgi:hypothetical protein
MRLSHYLPAGMALVLAISTAASAEDTAARDLINTVIEKNGGETLLAKFPARTSKIKGTLYLIGSPTPMSGELSSQGGDQHRMAVSLSADGQSIGFTSVLDRDRGWQRLFDNTSDMTDDQMTEAKEAAYAAWLATLLPLKGKAFELTALGESDVEKRPAIAVKVTSEGHRPVKMYFDKETFRLVRTETTVRDESTSKDVPQETTYSDFNSAEGIPHAKKVVIKREGQPYVDIEVISSKPKEKLEASVFAKP